MANHYTQLSFFAPMPQVHAEWIVALHQTYKDSYDNHETLADLKAAASQPDYMANVVRMVEADHGAPGLDLTADELGLYVTGDDVANVEYLADLLGEYLRHFDLPTPIGYEWANTCSKMRRGEFSGGACVVTREGINWINTTRWMEETMHALNPQAESVLL